MSLPITGGPKSAGYCKVSLDLEDGSAESLTSQEHQQYATSHPDEKASLETCIKELHRMPAGKKNRSLSLQL